MYGYDYWKTTDPNDTHENYLLAEQADSLQAEYEDIMDELKRKLDDMEQADDPNWGAADELSPTCPLTSRTRWNTGILIAQSVRWTTSIAPCKTGRYRHQNLQNHYKGVTKNEKDFCQHQETHAHGSGHCYDARHNGNQLRTHAQL
jgi:hypothetical protein